MDYTDILNNIYSLLQTGVKLIGIISVCEIIRLSFSIYSKTKDIIRIKKNK